VDSTGPKRDELKDSPNQQILPIENSQLNQLNRTNISSDLPKLIPISEDRSKSALICLPGKQVESLNLTN